MSAYCAVVKYALDAPAQEKRRALLEGLGMICMELVAEHGFDREQIEEALESAEMDAELELEMKRQRGGDDA